MPISKNMNTKNKNAKQCAANSYTPQGLGIAILQSEDVFTKKILQKYTDLPRKQVKTSNNASSIFRFIERQIKKGTRTFILHLNDEALLLLVNYLEDKLTKFNKYRKMFKGVELLETLSTSDDVRQRVKSTKYVKELMQFRQSPFSQVLSTFQPGDVGASSEEPVKKTNLVVVSNKGNAYYGQAFEYFKDNSNVTKMLVSELPITATALADFYEVIMIIDNIEEMNKVAKFLNDTDVVGTINVVNPTKDVLNESEFQALIAKKGVKCKSVHPGVKYNVDEGKYPEFSRPCEKQVIEIIEENSRCSGDFEGYQRQRIMNRDFSNSSLENENFSRSDLLSSYFTDATLTNSNFSRSVIISSYFTNANLTKSNFSRSFIRDSTFIDAKLIDAVFTRSVIRDSDFTNADLTNANFNRSVIVGSNFKDANLTNVDFRGSTIRRADVIKIAKDITRARFDQN